MLDSVTKKRIDDLRNILVGKTPSPESQVEQITTGLVYKFMHDIDRQAVEMGGRPSFFTGEYEKYAWTNLFNPKLEGADRVKLYSEAIEKMYTNPSAPPMFREIFKNAYLPFKNPSTLNMFLKGINEFDYSHSEKLGDAFEYLLSKMDSQGDAGQFRTPRHIIDFIVEIINPQKNERILDPACGTAGFLISSYKHIQKQNTRKKLGDRLSAAERKRIGESIVGYDISPDMTRISLVNMYLHQFATPQIYEYDTLSSDDRWNEHYDVILANPPFFSPTGGIQPHSRFGVQSTRAEVLFVDYIMEHLRPNGRAGIIVPEGIIFQAGKAYKALRKKLVEDCLVGVISLPAGVFNPYSGVKTSILILDKERSEKSDSIFFAKIENDGFSLGTQRTPIKQDDIPNVLESICLGDINNPNFVEVDKSKIIEKSDMSLSLANYIDYEASNSNFPMTRLGDVANFQNGYAFKPSDWSETGKPIIRIQNLTKSSKEINKTSLNVDFKYHVENGDLLISWSATIGVFIWEGGHAILNQHIFLVKPSDKILKKYLYFLGLKIEENIKRLVHGNTMTHITKGKFLNIKIPLPPIEIQQQIVDELDGYQKVIDGYRRVVENYKPTIDIDPSWKTRHLKEIMKVDWGNTNLTKNSCYHEDGKYLGVSAAGVDGKLNHFEYEDKGIVVSAIGANCGKVFYLSEKFTAIKNTMVLHSSIPSVNLKFYFYYFNSKIRFSRRGTGQPFLSKGDAEELLVPVPSKTTQDNIAKRMDDEASVVEGSRRLIETYTQKIQDRISKVWGE